MAEADVKVWVHLIWATHNGERVLHKNLRVRLLRHLVEHAKEESLELECVHVQPEHVHCLFLLPSDRTLASIVKALKGESSRWINEHGFVRSRFRWQRGYGAFSVSASQVERVKRYIGSQEEHHRRQGFREEYVAWQRRYGIDA